MSRLVLIAGTSFCGSTLLAMLLDSHPEIASISEIQGPLVEDKQGYRCSCGKTMSECRFWERVRKEMQRRDVDFAVDRWGLTFELGTHRVVRHLLTRSLRSNLLDDVRDGLVCQVGRWRSRLDETRVRNEAFVDSVLSITGKKVFVDGSKDPIRARFLDKSPALRPKVIHLVRDSPGFVKSHVKNTGASIESGISLWNRMAGHCTRLFDWLPEDRTQRVRYEDLCADPVRELNRIAALAGVSRFPDLPVVSGAEHHILGNRMRLGPIRPIALDESWKTELIPEQIDTITRRTARYRRRFGYRT